MFLKIRAKRLGWGCGTLIWHSVRLGKRVLLDTVKVYLSYLKDPLGKVDGKKQKKTDKCQFWPYIHTYYIKTDIFLFFPKRPLK